MSDFIIFMTYKISLVIFTCSALISYSCTLFYNLCVSGEDAIRVRKIQLKQLFVCAHTIKVPHQPKIHQNEVEKKKSFPWKTCVLNDF